MSEDLRRTILRPASAGSLMSGDCLIEIRPGAVDEARIQIRSIVEKRFGDAIRLVCERVIATHGAVGIECLVTDRGALDFVIEARVRTAILRATRPGGENP